MKLLKAFLMAVLLVIIVNLFVFFLMWLQTINVIWFIIVMFAFIIITTTIGVYFMMGG